MAAKTTCPDEGFSTSVKTSQAASVNIDVAIYKISRQNPLPQTPKLADVPPHFEACKETARKWFTSVRKELMTANHATIAFSDDFICMCDELVAEADKLQGTPDSMKEIVKGLKHIKNKFDSQHQRVKCAGVALKAFYNELLEHEKVLKADDVKATDTAGADQKEMAVLKTEVSKVSSKVHELISKLACAKSEAAQSHIAMKVCSAVSFIPIFGWIAGIVSAAVDATKNGEAAKVAEELQAQQIEQNKLEAKLADLDKELVLVTLIHNGLTAIIAALSVAIAAVDELDKNWTQLGVNYDSLSDDLENQIEEVGPGAHAFLKQDLSSSKMKWGDIRSMAKKLEEEFLQPIAYVVE